MNYCTLTESAKEQIDALCNENSCYAVTLNLKGGGCAGFEYQWDTISNPEDVQDDDTVITTDKNGKLVIGALSLAFLVGTEIDYQKTIMGAGFELNNPNAKGSCGCGVSVQFDMDNLPTLTNLSYSA